MTELTAHTVKLKGAWSGDVRDRVVLSYDDRFRRRILLKGEQGTQVLLSLKEAQHLQSGDALVCGDGSLIEVIAAPEQLIEIRCETEILLLRMAWHLGNRHLPTQIESDCIRIRYDKVILDMVTGLGGDVSVIDEAFNPEGGAYGGHGRVLGHDHDTGGDTGDDIGHSQDHSHGHSLAHSHDHGSEHEHGHEHEHKHGHSHGS